MIDPIINAVLRFEEPPTEAAILELMQSLLAFERFSKVASRGSRAAHRAPRATAHWEDSCTHDRELRT